MKVFISYAREDRPLAAVIAEKLTKQGIEVWWDFNLVGGDRYRDAITEHLNSSDKTIVLWSKHSIVSDFVLDEASVALQSRKLIPISIDGSMAPLGFRNIHNIDYKGGEQNVDEIVAAVRNQPIAALSGALLTAEAARGVPLGGDTGDALLFAPAASPEKYGVLYLNWLVMMITRPTSLAVELDKLRTPADRAKVAIAVIAISVLIAASLGATMPDRPPLAGRLQILVVVSCVWLFWAILIHLFCRMFGGRGEAMTAVLITMHTLAFTYLISNFVTFMLWTMRAYYPALHSALNSLGLTKPGTALILLQAALLLPLIPLTLGRAHVFSSAIMGAFVALFAAILAGITAAPIVSAGGC